MEFEAIKKKTVTREILDIPFGARVKVPTGKIYDIEKTIKDDICVCVRDDEDGCAYEWYHYSKCQLVKGAQA